MFSKTSFLVNIIVYLVVGFTNNFMFLKIINIVWSLFSNNNFKNKVK